jgi:hypothetical protein
MLQETVKKSLFFLPPVAVLVVAAAVGVVTGAA